MTLLDHRKDSCKLFRQSDSGSIEVHLDHKSKWEKASISKVEFFKLEKLSNKDVLNHLDMNGLFTNLETNSWGFSILLSIIILLVGAIFTVIIIKFGVN